MNQSSYFFKDIWIVEAKIRETEAVLLDIHSWKKWWNGLIRGEVVKPDHNIVGSIIKTTWISTFGYKLTLRLTITDYDVGKYITFQSEGDLVGEGRWTFIKQNDNLTKMEIIWNVAPTKLWMKWGSLFLRPLFVYAHGKLMRQGEAGLRQYLS